jgi:gamma-glutamyltranspeptidase / glutathione hydrolase
MLVSALALALVLQGGNPQPVSGTKGMVVADEPLAAQVGVEILRKGGNAVDAAVAVAFAMAVVQPTAGNIGGGGFMLVRMADGRTVFIDYREQAPLASHRDMYAERPEASRLGLLAGGVPGTVAGMEEAMRRYGKLRWRDVVEPAYRLAHSGFPISGSQSRAIERNRETLAKYPDTNRIYLRGGNLYRPGEIVRLPDLAGTLGRIRDRGASDFYTGETARRIAADMKTRGGLITLEDLKQYRVRVREPLKGTYRGHQIYTAPPPSSGGIAMLHMMNLMEGYGRNDPPYGSADRYHLVIEAMKLAFADRAELLGDPDFVSVPTAELISKEYAEQRRKLIDPKIALRSEKIRPGLDVRHESEQTTHYSVVDADGNAVANTYTINGSFGSFDTIVGTGILLNNEMDDFAAQPGKPNMFGLMQGERNAIQPLKRPLSSMTPTIVTRDGKLLLVVGSPGGPTIINTVTQVIMNVIDHDMTIMQAVQAPRLHHQWLPDQVRIERRWVSPDTVERLVQMGHILAPGTTSLGTVNSIWVDPQTGVRHGGADTRYTDARAAAQ